MTTPTQKQSETLKPCQSCKGILWVCENHPNQPWGGMTGSKNACDCGAGEPCKNCNISLDKECPPKMPDDFEELE